jgi:hypothetical protein
MKNIATPQYYYVLKHYLIITKKKRTFNIYIYIERERENAYKTQLLAVFAKEPPSWPLGVDRPPHKAKKNKNDLGFALRYGQTHPQAKRGWLSHSQGP